MVRLRNRLSFKQARYMALIALLLSLMLGSLHSTLDYFATKREFGLAIREALGIMTKPASQAVYNFDDVLAREVVDGLVKYRMFYRAVLQDDHGKPLAAQEQAAADWRGHWLAEFLYADLRAYQVPLTVEGKVYGALRVDVDVALLADTFLNRVWLALLFNLLALGLLAVIFYLLLRVTITDPLTRLSGDLARIDARNPEKLRLRLPNGHHDDELGQLTQAANALLASVDEKVAQQTRMNEELELRVAQRTEQVSAANLEISALNQRLQNENLRLGAELDVSRRLQQMVLPKPHELARIKALDIACFMQPASEVGGDYYDVLQGETDQVKIGIGDVTGHGLESGVVMLMVQMAVRTLLANRVSDPGAFLHALNRALYCNVQRMESDKNLTLALLDYQDGNLRLSGQHEEVLLVRKEGTVERIDTLNLGFMVGLQRDIQQFVGQLDFTLAAGDGVVLYTDGITEAFSPQKQIYGVDRLCAAVSRVWRDSSAEQIKQAIIADVQAHLGGVQPLDDLTLVILKQRGV